MHWLVSLVLLVVLMSIQGVVRSQDKIRIADVDSVTYRAWWQQDWETLIRTGEEARSQGIDFYYLRLRLGVAWFMKQQYRKAEPYFVKVLNGNPKDSVAQEYLYYCYLYAGKEIQAHALAQSFVSSVRKKTNTKSPHWLSGCSTEYGQLLPDRASLSKISALATDQDNHVAKSVLTRQHYTNMTARIFPLKNTLLTLSFTGLKNEKAFQVKRAELSETPAAVAQNQVYAGWSQHLGNNWYARGSMHYLHVSYTAGQYEMNSSWYDSYGHRSYDTVVMVNGMPRPLHIEEYDTVYNLESIDARSSVVADTLQNYVFSAGIGKHLALADLHLEAYWGTINLDDYRSIQLAATCYPFGNLNTYVGAVCSWHRNTFADTVRTTRWALSTTVGQKLHRHIWLEAFYRRGDIQHMAFNSGMLVFNNTYRVSDQVRLGMVLPVKQFTFYVNYQWSFCSDRLTYYQITGDVQEPYAARKTIRRYTPNGILISENHTNYTYFTGGKKYVENDDTFTFINQLITGGVKWSF